jgi:geranylgeranyl diphosphate synthase type II
MNIEKLIKENAAHIEGMLERYVGGTDPDYGVIFEAMRYSLLSGGKRLRPFLTLEFARLSALNCNCNEDNAVESAQKRALAYACAVEMIHTYSLIHDDLPCMDDDNLRRGKPTNHIQFGEANALLAGDALLTMAFEVAASNSLASPESNCRAVRLLAECAGASGMIGGQVLDLAGEIRSLDFETLERLQSLKTGELIRAASLLGCYAGGASDELIRSAESYSLGIGRAFQVIDDILDVNGDESVLGKPIGSDAGSGKTTFLSFMSIDEAREYAVKLTNMAKEALKNYKGAEILTALADFLLTRNL